MDNDISFCELRKKEVVNAADGSKLGHIVDMIISVESKAALGIVAPAKRSGLFGSVQRLWLRLRKAMAQSPRLMCFPLKLPSPPKM